MENSDYTINTRGFRKYVDLIPRNRGNLILPNINADSPDFLGFLGALSDRCEDKFGLSKDEGGLLLPPYSPGRWTSLRHISGYKMNPLGIPRLGVKARAGDFIDPDHKKLFHLICDAYFREWSPAAARINKGSSTGLPLFSFDPSVKMNYAHIFKSRARQLMPLMRDRRWFELHEKYGLSMMSAITRRYQSTDKVEKQAGGSWKAKDRPVMTFEGVETIADKATPFEGFFAQRVRLAIAFSASYGIFGQMIFSGYRQHAIQKACWHHTTPWDIASKFSNHPYIIAGDVSNFDQNMPSFLVDLIFERLSEDWDDAVVELFKACVGCPMLVNEDRVGGGGRHKWLADPTNNDNYYSWYGFPSGIPPVSDVGKIIGLFVDLVPLLDLGLISTDGLQAVMDNNHDQVSVANSGDDFILGFTNASDLKRVTDYFEEDLHPYFEVGVERPASFLGNLMVQQRGQVLAYPNVRSFLINTFGRERGIDSRFNRNYAFGYWEKKTFYAVHPLFSEVDRVLQDTARKHLRYTIDELTPYQAAPQGLAMSNFADRMFVSNPDAIHYKLDPKDVSPDLLDSIFITIPADEVGSIVQEWRK
jgi:hypothetical protein